MRSSTATRRTGQNQTHWAIVGDARRITLAAASCYLAASSAGASANQPGKVHVVGRGKFQPIAHRQTQPVQVNGFRLPGAIDDHELGALVAFPEVKKDQHRQSPQMGVSASTWGVCSKCQACTKVTLCSSTATSNCPLLSHSAPWVRFCCERGKLCRAGFGLGSLGRGVGPRSPVGIGALEGLNQTFSGRYILDMTTLVATVHPKTRRHELKRVHTGYALASIPVLGFGCQSDGTAGL